MTIGGATKRRRGRRKGNRKRLKTKPQSKLLHPQSSHHKHLSTAISTLISATSATRSFLLRHDLHLLPSQTLALESLLSSTSRSLFHLLSLVSIPAPPSPTPPLSPPPQQNWFDRFMATSPDYDPRWVQFFNLSKPSFTLLLRLLTPSLTSSLHPLLPNAALAATLFRLSHSASFSAVSRRFSLDSRTACTAFYSVCRAIVENLGHLFEFNSDINRIIVGFGWISLPNCCGVLGVEKFELESDLIGENRRLLVQALVDSEGRFLDVSAGWPGSLKPEDVLKRSKLFSGVEESKEYLNGPSFNLNPSDAIPQYILGESCYPLLPWLLTPYGGKNRELSSSEMEFNGVHCKGMELVGTAFAKVKKKWKLVGRKWKEQCIEAFPFVIVACCLLHNFLIKCSEVLPEENAEGCKETVFMEFDGEDSESGKRTRDALASHLSRSNQQDIRPARPASCG
ncbi:protein ALP1-like isoform X2 [Salvia miltiorrhiza]|uniref:protein ALP1-like isoform X2 n=1 Tax=Salvia miltiorrhiza TaxID=226208 RepID=UPI0025ABD23E|nr:protein ALP1-like isoform X2 [Salvia miltiorrhiza]